jgi:TonB-linked SusC/RagA family outer membrane protein
MQLTAIVRLASCRSGLTRKIIRVMKLTAILITVACLHVAAKSHSQTLTISLKNATLQQAFNEIKKQSGFSFLYNDKTLMDAKKINLQVTNVSLEEVLDKCFEDQPLTYTIVDKTIVVKKKEVEITGHEKILNELTPPIDVRGRIFNTDGDPVAGASVSVKGSKPVVGTTTTSSGEFTLTSVPENATLVFSGINIETFEMPCSAFQAGVVKELTAKIKISPLDEIQIQAYGTTNRRIGTGNITTIKGSDIEKQPVSNPLLALQGRVPGLFITQATGLPGSGVSVKVQGQNSISINIGNDPLYVIDGVPYPSRTLGTLSPIQGSSGSSIPPGSIGEGNPLSYINPMDIESIEVLKDADATAIYGSKAANGAILITTKKGKSGTTRVDINIQKGFGKVERKLDLMNTEQYLEMRKEAFVNAGMPIPTPTLPDNQKTNSNYDLTVWDQTRYTDWQKTLIGGTAEYTNIQATVSGGTANTKFLISPSYNKETTVFPGDQASKTGSLHFNINNTSSNQKFNFQLTGSYSINDTKLNSRDLTTYAMSLAPNAPSLYKSDGSLNWEQVANGDATWTNPLAYLLQEYSNKTNNLVSNCIISYRITKGLEIKSNFGYTNMESNQYLLLPRSAVLPQNRLTTDRESDFRNTNINSFIIEPQLNYKTTISNSKFEFLLGSSIQQTNSISNSQAGFGYANDVEMKNLSAAPTRTVSRIGYVYKYNALFGRINYDLNDRYIASVNVRRDGSSRFGQENQFHNFGSIAGAWVFSSEKVIKNNLKFLSFGKLRASYGTTGNDQIGDYQFLDLYNSISLGSGSSYQGTIGYTPANLPNPYLEWEETKKLNVGIDLGFFNDRILLNVNYSRNRSSNQLLGYALPVITGFSRVTRNFPALVQNKDWELSLQSKNIVKKTFSWSSSFNVTVPSNKLISFPGLSTSSYASQLIEGQPISIFLTYKSAGVNSTTGLYQFYDKSGNITTSPVDNDKTVRINTLPEIYGGLQNTIHWKSFELDFLFQFVKQIGRDYYFGNGSSPGPGRFFGTTNLGNQPKYLLDRWRKPGDVAPLQMVTTASSAIISIGNAGLSDFGFRDASFIRFKNLSLGWNLPSQLLKNVKMQTARIFLHGQNLLTVTKYKGLDPETRSATTLPPLRTITFGIQCSF